MRAPALAPAALALAICATAVAVAGAQEREDVRGRILDARTGAPLSGVWVALRGTDHLTSTERSGRFTLRGLPAGTYVLEARAPGYEPLIRADISVPGRDHPDLELVMEPLPYRLREIVVSPGTFDLVKAGPDARQVMTRDDIETVPQFGEDIFRVVNRLPGISSGDFGAHFSIRGGRPDETLILLDGLEIYEPYHLKDFHEGAVSIVDVEAIEGVELMTGGFPARYGNRRGGVFSIASRTPAAGESRTSLGASFINARAMSQGTFSGGRGAWLLSGRRGYLDLILGLLNINDIPRPAYHDVFGKLRYQVHPRHSLELHALDARDSYTLDGLATTGFDDSIPTRETATNRYGNSYVWATLASFPGDRLTVTSMVSRGLVTNSRDGAEFHRVASDTMYAIRNRRDFTVTGFRQEWLLELSGRVLVDFGADIRRFDAEYTIHNRVWKDPDDPAPDTTGFFPQETRTGLARTGTTAAGWLGGRLQPLERLTVELGLRYDRSTYTRDRDLSPRLGALVRLGAGRQLRLGWGHYVQDQGISELAALGRAGRYFPSELTVQWTAGFEQQRPHGQTLRVEAYHRRGSRLRPVYRNWKGVIDVFPEVDEDRLLVYPTATTSRGIELYYARELGERLSLRGSYALAYANETVSRISALNFADDVLFERTHPAPFDQRHAVRLDLTHRPSRKWSLSAAYSFHTGWPTTLQREVPVTGPGGQPDVAFRPDTIYGSRLPDYHRLDFRLTRRSGSLRFYLEVLNLTNRTNVSGYDYFLSRTPGGDLVLEREPERWFTILPSLGISWSRGG